MSRSCKTCKYYDPANMLARCILCRPEMKDWEPKDRNQTVHCETCRYEEKSAYREPCISCGIAWPGNSSHWEPKAETKEEDMGEKNTANTYMVTFTPDQINKKALDEIIGTESAYDDIDEAVETELQLKAALEENERLKGEVHDAQIAVAKYVGMVEGLKHGIAAIVTMMGGDQDE